MCRVKSRFFKVGPIVFLGAALVRMTLLIGNQARAQPPLTQKAILYAGDRVGLEALQSRNGRLIQDYGSFSLWDVADPDLGALAEASQGLSFHPEFDQLLLREASIDTRLPDKEARLEAQGGDLAEGGYQLHLVQFVGPVLNAWLDDLRVTGARIVAYVPYNGYIVWADEDARAQIARRVAERIEYQWHGRYWPSYRLARSLRAQSGDQAVDVVVQILDHAGAKQGIRDILAQAETVLREPHTVLQFVNLAVRLPASALPGLAARADVFNVEPWQSPTRLDERQGQIMIGSLNPDATQPANPGYLERLNELGFSWDPVDYPIVDVVDDGLDNGNAGAPAHPDFHRLGDVYQISRIAYARDLTGDGDPHGVGGHGTLNASIVGGHNARSEAIYQDLDGYQYGLGISPYGRIASTKVFNDLGNWGYSGSLSALIRGSYLAGARITNNSWSSGNSGYTADAQAFDVLTRDADPAAPGNQEMTHVFAAGNDGPTVSSVTAPGTAKNVISVGASESYRPSGQDGCGFGDTMANNVQDIAEFSSRGPTSDGRAKPDVVAPGTHIQGAASQDPAYNANGICDPYFPDGQKLYTWSSGTSHSAPAVAGALSLIQGYFAQDIGGDLRPSLSPAMLKAYLVNAGRYIQSWLPGDSLPSSHQGWGRVDLGTAFDGVPRLLVDQDIVLRSTGQSSEWTGIVANLSAPFRVTLAWTDAPGSTTAASWVNNLDLEVTVGGQTYKGNVLEGSSSIVGGEFDAKNNVESVFLPPGTNGSFSIRVLAANLAGDGVPGNDDVTDQDFALVIYNGVREPDFQLHPTPLNGEICQGSELTYTIGVTGLFGYALPVSLAHSTSPSGVGLALSPVSGVPTFEAALRATASPTASVGLYTMTVTGTGDRTHVATVTLAVDSVAPTGTVLLGPANAAVGISLRPSLSWQSPPNARSFRLQLAGDPLFQQLVLDEVTHARSYTLSFDLARNTTYYWRVESHNGCGAELSPTRVFTTVNLLYLFYSGAEGDVEQWRTETIVDVVEWALADGQSHSGTSAWHIAAHPTPIDARLATAKAVLLDETSTLRFWHWYDLEATDDTAWDGGVLEISADGGAWQDLGDYMTGGGYGHAVPTGLENPLQGRSAWSGNSAGWQQVSVDLSAYAGRSARIRFRYGGDINNMRSYAGWYVDDVQITTVRPPFVNKVYLPAVGRR